jgi:hypothetical protein
MSFGLRAEIGVGDVPSDESARGLFQLISRYCLSSVRGLRTMLMDRASESPKRRKFSRACPRLTLLAPPA